MIENINILLLLNQKRKYIFDRLTPQILHNIKMKNENKDILNAIRKMNLNFGINPVLIRLVFGIYICFGINQALNKVMKILKNDFYKKISIEN